MPPNYHTQNGCDARTDASPDGGTPYGDTIDWDAYWDASDEVARSAVDASPSATYIREPLRQFLDAKGRPESPADVGCGTGTIVFDLANAYPDSTIVGYDAAAPILQENRRRAEAKGYDNLSFERTVLPAFSPARQFDLVTCFFTLCYVAETERALVNLYDAVEPGGHLVFTYHNRDASAFYERAATAPHDNLDDSFPGDPESFYDRFQLVIEGESLLSSDRIHDALGTWPQSVWALAEDAEPYGASRAIPLVFVPK